jgi:hypothetical protein
MFVSSVFSSVTKQSDTPDRAFLTTSVAAWVTERDIEIRKT